MSSSLVSWSFAVNPRSIQAVSFGYLGIDRLAQRQQSNSKSSITLSFGEFARVTKGLLWFELAGLSYSFLCCLNRLSMAVLAYKRHTRLTHNSSSGSRSVEVNSWAAGIFSVGGWSVVGVLGAAGSLGDCPGVDVETNRSSTTKFVIRRNFIPSLQ